MACRIKGLYIGFFLYDHQFSEDMFNPCVILRFESERLIFVLQSGIYVLCKGFYKIVRKE